jgi:hypothetical protein
MDAIPVTDRPAARGWRRTLVRYRIGSLSSSQFYSKGIRLFCQE